MPFFHPKGMVIWNALLEYWRMEHRAAGYVETKTPIMLNRALWERSGHWANYRENMYTSTIDEVEYAIKPMNCPAHCLMYSEGRHSYRELPIRLADFGRLHRYELSGVVAGLTLAAFVPPALLLGSLAAAALGLVLGLERLLLTAPRRAEVAS